MALIFKNPSNNYIESSSIPFLWSLLFGTFYFLFKGIWSHAIISGVLAFFTFGFSWLLYPFFARDIVEGHYLKKGWVKMNSYDVEDAKEEPK